METVNHPLHYGGDTTYETIKVLEAWLTREEFHGWLKGTIIKYLSRAGKKAGAGDDEKKAKWYQDYLDGWLARLKLSESVGGGMGRMEFLNSRGEVLGSLPPGTAKFAEMPTVPMSATDQIRLHDMQRKLLATTIELNERLGSMKEKSAL